MDAVKALARLGPLDRVQVTWSPRLVARLIISIRVGKPRTFVLLESRGGKALTIRDSDRKFREAWDRIKEDWDLDAALGEARAYPRLRHEVATRKRTVFTFNDDRSLSGENPASTVPSGRPYTRAERERQLVDLINALTELIPEVEIHRDFADKAESYSEARSVAKRFLTEGFTQDDLSALSCAIPDVFSRYKDWVPPWEPVEGGGWKEAAWFVRLDGKLQHVLEAAILLRTVGHS
jgi:hypothetical protein